MCHLEFKKGYINMFKSFIAIQLTSIIGILEAFRRHS